MITKEQIPPELIYEARNYILRDPISFTFSDPSKRIAQLEKEIEDKQKEIKEIKEHQLESETRKQRMIDFLELIGEEMIIPK